MDIPVKQMTPNSTKPDVGPEIIPKMGSWANLNKRPDVGP